MTTACVFPTSFAQRRIWFLDRLVPESSFYNIHIPVPLAFEVDVAAMRRTLDEIVLRHETLRTVFAEEKGQPVQVIRDEIDLELVVTDLSSLAPADRDAEASRLATEHARTPFDLAAGPLLRAGLLQLGPGRFVLLLTIHHIVSDAWSMAVLLRELGELYGAFVLGRPSPLSELEIQYADFAVWQAEYLQGDMLEQQLAYWRERLQECPVLNLPTDHARPSVPSFAGRCHQFELPRRLVEGVEALARSAGCTPYMVYLAGFEVVLQRITGQGDIVVGAPTANRTRSELEHLIGFFVNTLVLRTDLSGDPTVFEAIRRIRESCLGAFANQDLPFERLVEEIQSDRDLSRNPLFQVTFQLHNEPGVDAPTQPAADWMPQAKRGTANFDIACDLWPSARGMVVRFDYATDLFDSATIVRWGRYLQGALAEMVRDSRQKLSSVQVMPVEERRRMLVDWNATARPYPADVPLASLFERQVDATPDAVAVRFAGETLSYGELDRRANHVAQALRASGVSLGSVVAIATERSVERVVGLLGILKAGAAYLALDPDDPPPRLRQLISLADVDFVLTHTHRIEGLQALGVSVRALEGGSSSLRTVRDPAQGGDSLAYIAFTSGSTGQPKGVRVVQRAVARLVHDPNFCRLGPEDTLLHLSPLSFDASTFELWGALLNGARLEIQPPGPASLAEIGRVVRHGEVTVLWLTAGLFHQMVDHHLPDLAGVTTLLTGGSVVSPSHVRQVLELPGRRAVVNGYGPTENTTFSACHAVSDASHVTAPFPIGRPIQNSRAYVLDAKRRPVPVGTWGELLVAGDGLAAGYLDGPEESDRSFVDLDLEFVGTERAYCTGDVVRWIADGTLEFRGRTDRQVKLRGYRIEPGEIEVVLRGHPDVRDAAVIQRRGPSGDAQLTAFVVPRADDATNEAALRLHLRGTLPGYMVPAEFVLVRQLPLTANGKVDVGVLEGTATSPSRAAYEPPTTEVERVLVPLFEEVTGRTPVGINDGFFTDLGGHSLLGTQLVSRIRATFEVELPLRKLFEAPDVAELALAIEELLLAEIEAIDDSPDGADPEGA